jgi:hypothetical protein
MLGYFDTMGSGEGYEAAESRVTISHDKQTSNSVHCKWQSTGGAQSVYSCCGKMCKQIPIRNTQLIVAGMLCKLGGGSSSSVKYFRSKVGVTWMEEAPEQLSLVFVNH